MSANFIRKIALLVFLPSAFAFQEDFVNDKLAIVIYDSAFIGQAKLHQTDQLAEAVLRAAGIGSSWSFGPLSDLETLAMDFTARSEGECLATPTPSIVRIRILRNALKGMAPQALGFSLPCARTGVQIAIFADRVLSVAESGGPSFCRALTLVIAHELGHILLHSMGHARSGLMKGLWSQNDWQRLAVSEVMFAPAEARLIAALRKTVNANTMSTLPSTAAITSTSRCVQERETKGCLPFAGKTRRSSRSARRALREFAAPKGE